MGEFVKRGWIVRWSLALVGLFFLWGDAAFAARPMITDDARVVDTGACQLETWFKGQQGSDEYWAVPACSPTDWLEITAGAGFLLKEGVLRTSGDSALLQVKTLLKRLPDSGPGWGVGWVVGSLSREHEPSDLLGSYYTYTPISLTLGEEVILHINPGWLHERNPGRSAFTWGMGTEINLAPRLQAIAETFGEEGAGNYYQGGLRLWIVPDHIQLDTTYGNRFSGGEGWWTVGLRLISKRLF
ncbi:MAG: hypothetical protein P3W87_002875 [Gammaproteobacteria bacterium]|nr:hypothetical protein [Gammaproteobacteria bacterium]